MYTIELKYLDPITDDIRHFFFPAAESKLSRDYHDDAVDCGCIILLWRLVPNRRIHVV